MDASGQASGSSQALRITKSRGTFILNSTFASREPVVDLSKVVVGELNILGSRCGPFADALTLLKQKILPIETLIDGRYALADGLAAFQQATQPGVRKILLKP